MKISDLPAIDAHAHYGTYRRDDGDALIDDCMTGSAAEVVARARACNVEWTIASPLFPPRAG